jgi:hypothetical protein
MTRHFPDKYQQPQRRIEHGSDGVTVDANSSALFIGVNENTQYALAGLSWDEAVMLRDFLTKAIRRYGSK